MKKLNRILPIILLLSLTGCNFFRNDFFRAVAGRPSADEVRQMKDSALKEREKERQAAEARAIAIRDSIVRDSLLRVEAARDSARMAAAEALRRDSLEGAAALENIGVQVLGVSRFGKPLAKPLYKYNIVVGVFRTEEAAAGMFNKMSRSGFHPYTLMFEGGTQAVCMYGDDSLSSIANLIMYAKPRRTCPDGSWVYVYR